MKIQQGNVTTDTYELLADVFRMSEDERFRSGETRPVLAAAVVLSDETGSIHVEGDRELAVVLESLLNRHPPMDPADALRTLPESLRIPDVSDEPRVIAFQVAHLREVCVPEARKDLERMLFATGLGVIAEPCMSSEERWDVMLVWMRMNGDHDIADSFVKLREVGLVELTETGYRMVGIDGSNKDDVVAYLSADLQTSPRKRRKYADIARRAERYFPRSTGPVQ